MPVGLELDAHTVAALEPLGDVIGGDAFARTAEAVVAHGGDEQVRLVREFAARRGDRIGARRQRPRQRAQVLRCERNREIGDEVDELAAGDPVGRLVLRQQRPDVLVAGLRRIGFQRSERARGDVARLNELVAQRLVFNAGKRKQFVDVSGIVLGVEIERIAGLVAGAWCRRRRAPDGWSLWPNARNSDRYARRSPPQ
jgi:hypothetical protein